MKPKRPSLHDVMTANAKAMRGLMALSGKTLPPELEAPVREAKKVRAAPTPSNIPTEHEEQKAFVKWFRMQYPRVRIFAVPNAAMRSVELASYLRAEGMTPGVPDLVVIEWKLLIEMKRVKGSVISDEQREWREYAHRIGWHHIYGYGFEDARKKVLELVSNP